MVKKVFLVLLFPLVSSLTVNSQHIIELSGYEFAPTVSKELHGLNLRVHFTFEFSLPEGHDPETNPFHGLMEMRARLKKSSVASQIFIYLMTHTVEYEYAELVEIVQQAPEENELIQRLYKALGEHPHLEDATITDMYMEYRLHYDDEWIRPGTSKLEGQRE
ncbi:hypothetical protein SAMN05920897_1462 [Alkalispirochaeta americana]|uniref:Uncharacterized protein n=1 Tax=Alkalispirochaeta americana TaxID=159291 RepID=A0A1N6YAM0_9SPIO|nr:hypothetical protein [Alkalispirochaeta americana]SIR11675.1 hypothetical protein SAMN05920897_1462 [Alkalispirochaeta americana]